MVSKIVGLESASVAISRKTERPRALKIRYDGFDNLWSPNRQCCDIAKKNEGPKALKIRYGGFDKRWSLSRQCCDVAITNKRILLGHFPKHYSIWLLDDIAFLAGHKLDAYRHYQLPQWPSWRLSRQAKPGAAYAKLNGIKPTGAPFCICNWCFH